MAYSNATADKQWFGGFMISNPKLSLRQLEFTSSLGVTGFNKLPVNKFFDVLKHFVDENKITVTRLLHTHETLRRELLPIVLYPINVHYIRKRKKESISLGVPCRYSFLLSTQKVDGHRSVL
jgi:hypothetical protein